MCSSGFPGIRSSWRPDAKELAKAQKEYDALVEIMSAEAVEGEDGPDE